MDKWYYMLEFAVAIVAVVAFMWVYGRGKLSKETLDLMQVNKKAQDDAIKRLQDNDNDKSTKIAHLTGQVDLLKDIPLRSISKSLEMLSTSHDSLIKYTANHDAVIEASMNTGVQRIVDHIDAVMKPQSNTTIALGKDQNANISQNK